VDDHGRERRSHGALLLDLGIVVPVGLGVSVEAACHLAADFDGMAVLAPGATDLVGAQPV